MEKQRRSSKVQDAKRRAVLDAGAAAFADAGLSGATMRAIAERAGVTTGTLYSMFDGKESIYAALLAQSLDRLHVAVAEAAASAPKPEQALRASVEAFYSYYEAKGPDFELGLYSFDKTSPISLGPDNDSSLNASLLRTLDVIGTAIARVAPSLPQERVTAERDAIFAALLGLLVMAKTGRARSIGTSPDTLLQTHLDALIARL